jgi:hypothetical protein
MAKVPQLTLLRSDDLKDLEDEGVQKAFDQVFFALNPFLTAVRDALGGRLGYENQKATIKTVQVNASAYPILVTTDLPTSPVAVLAIQALDTSDARNPVAALAPRLAWIKSGEGNGVRITQTDLDTSGSKSYALTLLITGA